MRIWYVFLVALSSTDHVVQLKRQQTQEQAWQTQVSALEDKYQAVKHICQQLEFRLLDQAAEVELAQLRATTALKGAAAAEEHAPEAPSAE